MKNLCRRAQTLRRKGQNLRINVPVQLSTLSEHLRHYDWPKAQADLKAGTNVALLALPQAMAYAMIAGLPVQYGVYGAAIASIVFAPLASSRFTMVGPSNATAVMVLSVFMGLPPEMNRLACVGLLVGMVGVFLIAGSFLRVAGLTQYVSRSVVVGYITAAALLIIVNQLHHVLGFRIGEASTFWTILRKTAEGLSQTEWITVALAAMTAGLSLWSSRKFPRLPHVAVTLVLCGIAGTLLLRHGSHLAMVKPIPFGSWHWQLPELNVGCFRHLVSGAFALAFLATLENTFMAKTLASRSGERVDVNQEMFALGVANMASSVGGGMPASGSLSRSALNWSSGAVTPISSIFCGILCAIAAVSLGFLVGYIPQASLAVVVILISVSLIDFKAIRLSLKSTKSDAAVFLTTFIAALVAPLDFAIFLGVGLSIVLFLRKASAPQLQEYTFNDSGQLAELADGPRHDPQISIIHVEGELFFGAADLFRDEIRRVCADTQLKVIVLRLKNAHHLDATSVMALTELIQYLRQTNRHLVISGASRDVYRVCKNSGLLELLGRENFFMASVGNPNLSTRNALLRAAALLGKQQVDVRIFHPTPVVSSPQTA